MKKIETAPLSPSSSRPDVIDSQPRGGGWVSRLPWLLTLFFVVWYASKLRVPKDTEWRYDLAGRIPVVSEGRHMPMDSMVRDVLVQLRGKQTANYEPWKSWWQSPKIASAMEWGMEVMLNPDLADTRPVIRIDNPDVRGFFGLSMEADAAKKADGKHYSWAQLQPRWDDFVTESQRISEKEAEKRNAYERAVIQLANAASKYRVLKLTFGPAASGDLAAGVAEFNERIKAWRAAVTASMNGQRYERMDYGWGEEHRTRAPLIAPRKGSDTASKTTWASPFEEVISLEMGQKATALPQYAAIAKAYRSNNPAGFVAAVEAFHTDLKSQPGFAADLRKASQEQRLSFAAPFFYGMYMAVAAALFAIAYWFDPKKLEWARRTAVYLMVLVLVIETAGLVFRYMIEGRPPVTTLYTSAIFIGWAIAIFGLLLERVYPFSIGVVVAAALGFCSLFVAHNLHIKDGTTFKVLQPVLDTNFWLATHVVIVTLGYAATFFAGALGTIWVIRAAAGGLSSEVARALVRMIYAVVCFAALFSFVGTVLGGLWADQSWGRFWGWDVKENGALMIVLWNAILLHARWGGLMRERGLVSLSLGGNIVTAWSWFGVNNLGVGLHSYGFTEGAAIALISYIGAQLLLIAAAYTWCPPKVEDGPNSPDAAGSPAAA